MKKSGVIFVLVFLCGGFAAAGDFDGGLELQKQRDRLGIESDYSKEYVDALETCAPFEKEYSLTTLNGIRRLSDTKGGSCNETVTITDKNGKSDITIVCNYPKGQLPEVVESYRKLLDAEKKYLITRNIKKGGNGIYKIEHSFNDKVITQPNYFFCKVQ